MIELECKQHSIGLHGNDRDVTSSGVCERDGVECHLAIAEGLSHGLIAGVPSLGKYGKEMGERRGERGIRMVG